MLELLREGLSNPEIAARLGISRDGAKYHVSEILTKLGVSSREEAAAWRHGSQRPWWQMAGAPLGWFSDGLRKLAASGVAGLSNVLAVVAIALVLSGLGLLAFFLMRGGGGEPAPNQLAYLDAEGALWLVDADGAGRQKLADDGDCPPGIEWSPTGRRLICGSGADRVVMDVEGRVLGEIEIAGLGQTHWSPSGEAILYWTSEGFAEDTEYELFLADKSGGLLAELGPWDTAGVRPGQAYRGFPLWSPDGSRLAYRSADTGEARIYSLDTGTEQVLEGDYHPLGWALDGAALLVAANYQPPPTPGAFPSYEVNLLDLSSGELLRRLPELDSRFQFWVSSDGTHVAALTRPNEGMHGPGLAVLDVRTGQFTPIANSVVSNPSDHIGKSQVRFSDDGQRVYWTDTGPPATVYVANSDATGLTKLVEVAWLQAVLSPGLRQIAYNVIDSDADAATLYIADIDGSNVRVIDMEVQERGSVFSLAWRPVPR